MASPVDQDNQPQDATDTDNLTVLTALLNAEDARLSEYVFRVLVTTLRRLDILRYAAVASGSWTRVVLRHAGLCFKRLQILKLF